MANARRKPAAKARPAASKRKSPAKASVRRRADDAFPAALAALLRSRKIAVPAGLEDAPPEAYANQPASFVDQLAKRPDAELKVFAHKIANHRKRQLERAKAAWDSSLLIAELRRRGLKEPPPPTRAVGVSVSLRKPLKEWTDAEIIRAATEWAKKK
jgi:hypothetical protein